MPQQQPAFQDIPLTQAQAAHAGFVDVPLSSLSAPQKEPKAEPAVDRALGAPSTARGALAQAIGTLAAPVGGLKTLRMVGRMLRGAGETAASHPIETGATLGAAAAVPLTGGASLVPALAASFLGGAGGAGAGEIYAAGTGSEPVPSTPAGVLGEMAAQGAIQAGAEGAGRGAQAAAAPIAKRFYRFALSPSVPLRQEFPTLAETGLREGVPVSKGGGVKTGGLLKQSSQDAQNVLRAAESARPRVAGLLPPATADVPLGAAPSPEGGSAALQPAEMTQPRKIGGVGNAEELLLRRHTPVFGQEAAAGAPDAEAATVSGPGVLRRRLGASEAPAGPGAPPGMIDPRAIARTGLGPVASDLSNRALGAEDAGTLSGLADRFLTTRNRPLTLSEANALKQAEQDLATGAYKRRDLGGEPLAVPDLFHEGIARGARQEIEKVVPQVGPINARTQELIGLDRALTRRLGNLENRSPVGMQHAINAGIAGALGGGSGYTTGDTKTGLGTGAGSLLLLEGLTNPALTSRLAIGLGRASQQPLSQAIRAAILARLRAITTPTAEAGRP